MTDFRNMDKSEYRYELDHSKPRKKLKCPSCGKPKSLTPYVDITTGEIIGDDFGICDHQNKCGYSKYPTGKIIGNKEIFVTSNQVLEKYKKENIEGIANTISYDKMMDSLSPWRGNDLKEFLCSVFDPRKVEASMRLYNVGSTDYYSWKNCCVFWQVDSRWKIRTGKIMGYDPITGNRIKEPFPQMQWYHVLEGKDFLLRQCLFGEHILNWHDNNKTVNVVESEKTAIICNILRPDEIFLATGGLQNMRQEVMGILEGRNVMLYPDKGEALDKWDKKAKMNLCDINITISDFLENKQEIKEGKDIADYMIIKEIKKRKV